MNLLFAIFSTAAIIIANSVYTTQILLPSLRAIYPQPGIYNSTSFLQTATLDALPALLGFFIAFLVACKIPHNKLRTVTVFIISFTSCVLASYQSLWPHVSDFGATWTDSEIVLELILEQHFTIYLYIAASTFNAGLILTRSFFK